MWAAVQAVPALVLFAHAALVGTVRSSADGRPLRDAVVEIPTAGRSASSDADGAYEIRDLEPGRYDVLVSRTGYLARRLVVVVPSDESLRVDIDLEPVPRALAPMRVVANPFDRTRRQSGDSPFAELGISSVAASRTRSEGSWLGQPDPFAALADAPGVVFDLERSAGLHVHGGESDQNLVLLDDAPVLAPYHFGTAVGTLNPDALSGIALHAGVPSAAWGDALSSVVTARTLTPGTARVNARGGLSPASVDLTLDGPLTRRLGFLLSVRHESTALFTKPQTDAQVIGANGDLLGKVTLDTKGRVEFLFLRSDNALGFQAEDPSDAASAAGGEQTSAGSSDAAPGSLASHRFDWRGSTWSARWDGHPTGSSAASLQVWRADLQTTIDWHAAGRPLAVSSARYGSGLKIRLSHSLPLGSLAAGVDAERDRVRYGVRDPGSAGAAALVSDSALGRVAGFVEHRFDTGRLAVSTGFRAALGTLGAADLEPRLAVRYRLHDGMALGAGFSRSYQPVQTLRNAASLASALFAADLPVISGEGRRRARADQVVVELTSRPGSRTEVTLDGYWRWLHGLVLVEPVTALPFADQRYDVGSGEAGGMSLSFQHRTARAAFAATYTLGFSSRGAARYEYHVGFDPRHALVTSLALNATPNTLVRLAAVARSRTTTSIVRGPFDWESCDPLGIGCEAAGSPQRTVGPLDGTAVPAFVRLDAGIRHTWSFRMGTRERQLTAYASYANLLGRHNVWAYTSAAGATDPLVGLAGRPPSLLAAGLEWIW